MGKSRVFDSSGPDKSTIGYSREADSIGVALSGLSFFQTNRVEVSDIKDLV